MNTRSWTVGTKIAFGFGLSVAILIAVGAVAYRAADTLIENDHLVGRTYRVLEAEQRVLSLAKDLETGQRGFVLTGDETYLAPYSAALEEITAAFEDLRRLLADDADQLKLVAQATAIADDKIAELKTTIDLRRRVGFDASLHEVLAGRGKRQMDELRRVFGEMDVRGRSTLRQRSESSEASAAGAKSTILFGALLALLLVSAGGTVIVRSLTRDLTGAITGIRSSTAELEAAAAQQASGSREQSSAATEVSTTMRELLSTSRQIAESAQRVARIASDTGGAARGGNQTVQRAQEAIVEIRRQVDVVVGHMLELGRKSQQAGGIVEIINELSEQTNIVAINASIEAAGAGESGKRFAVVADEIRKLADRVGGSTKEIRAVIEDIRAAVNTTVMATEGGTKAVAAGTTQFSEVTVSFRQVLDLVSTTTDAAQEIEISTKQQATAVEQVNVAIANVAQTTKETEASASQMLQTSTQLTGLARDILALIQGAAA